MQIEKEKELANATVLANATELSAQVVMKVAGSAIANTVGGVLMTPASLREAIVAKIQTALTKRGVGQ